MASLCPHSSLLECHCIAEVCGLPSDFIGRYNKEIALRLRRDIGLLNAVDPAKDYGDFWRWTKGILQYDKATSLRAGCQGVECGGLHENDLCRLICLSTCSIVGRIVWEGLKGVALLGELCHWG